MAQDNQNSNRRERRYMRKQQKLASKIQNLNRSYNYAGSAGILSGNYLFNPRSDTKQGYAAEAVYRWPALNTPSGIAAVQRFANIIASLDVKCFEKVGAEYEECELPRWLRRPIPGVQAYDKRALIWRSVSSLLLDGNVFLYRIANKRMPEQTDGLITLDPGQVDVSVDSSDYAEGLELSFSVSQSHNKNISTITNAGAHYGVSGSYTENEILWGYFMQLPHTLRGVSPFQLGSSSINIALAAQQYANQYFMDGANPTQVWNIKQAPDEDDEEAFREKLKQQHHGLTGQVPIITYGDMSVSPISFDPQRSMLVETRQQSMTDIGSLSGVPPVMLNDSRPGAVSYASADIQRRLFATDSIQPMTQLLEGLFDRVLAMEIRGDDKAKQKKVRFDIHDILKGDEATRRDLARKDVLGGVITRNEARESLGYDRIEQEGADELWMPVNTAMMSDALSISKKDVTQNSEDNV